MKTTEHLQISFLYYNASVDEDTATHFETVIEGHKENENRVA